MPRRPTTNSKSSVREVDRKQFRYAVFAGGCRNSRQPCRTETLEAIITVIRGRYCSASSKHFADMDALTTNGIGTRAMNLVRQTSVMTALASVGGLWGAYQLQKLASVVYLHFLRPCSIDQYAKGSTSTWALVTGSSDGIGKGFAEELCQRGFNVVLHGRNQTKLQAVKTQLLEKWPQREIRILVLDALTGVRSAADLQEAANQLEDLNLKILVNNIGGSGGLKPAWLPLAQRKPEDTSLFLDLNAAFPTEITRVLLPQLIRNGPALILSVGSVCGEVASPYASVYAGAKAYNKAWSRSLSLEMVAEGHNVEVLNILVGEVSSGSQPQELNFFCPSSRRMAKASLDKVGCGKDVVWAYWPHQLQFGTILKLPRAIMNRMILSMVLEEKAKEENGMKKKP
ncbi:short chain dehydrogenase [Acrodontium crateriforme]|uniref:Short chain dehydrogenase n=1 Tax=Acrodontium crateriforme TaxID=150365 RepID=A0AAQ3MC40_9PEZI|nr:short chain dehydrogenase [Acrodontium crateriforme]